MKAINPGIIYCSITGYGQDGPLADRAAHDLNYVADSGMLALCATRDGQMSVPHALLADIGGGTYPAMMNILLALRARDRDGQGSRIDVAMCENLFTFMYWGLGNGWAAGQWPQPGGDLVTGRSPRYNVYRTADGRFLAAAPLEEKFWANFLGVLGAERLRDDSKDPAGVRDAIAAIIAGRSAEHWLARFEGVEACVNLARSLEEAVLHPHFASRAVFQAQVKDGAGQAIPALPVPISPQFRNVMDDGGYPPLECA
jgi:crotonobetainyl-CoA:carnitine CoA-transferase CaiB-like acyl-CoA transferase